MEVTVEDQQKINTFSQLNTRKHELEDMLRVKAVSRRCKHVHVHQGPRPCNARAHSNTASACSQSESEDLEEAGNELMLVDDEEVRHRCATRPGIATGLTVDRAFAVSCGAGHWVLCPPIHASVGIDVP